MPDWKIGLQSLSYFPWQSLDAPGWLQLGVKVIMKELFVYAAFKIKGSLKDLIPVEVLKTLKA